MFSTVWIAASFARTVPAEGRFPWCDAPLPSERCTRTSSDRRGTPAFSLGPSPQPSDVNRVVGHLVELFRALAVPPKKSVQGLWAELYLIAYARDPVALAQAWHSSPQDKFDFSEGDQRIEVKSATDRVRQHRFLPGSTPARAPVERPDRLDIRRAIGSRLAPGGLLDRVESRSGDDHDLRWRVDQVVGQTLGQNLRAGMAERFDRELAREPLEFFEADRIPAVGVDLPAGVSDVRFKSDLTGVPPSPAAAIRARGGLSGPLCREVGQMGRRKRRPLTLSQQMARIQKHNTRPEVALRKALWSKGRPLPPTQKLPQQPGYRHRRAEVGHLRGRLLLARLSGPLPGAEIQPPVWLPKIERNMSRDRKVNAELAEQGWTVLRFWEHEIWDGLATVVEKALAAIESCKMARGAADDEREND